MIYINLTYGFGNNLFQFHFGRIISKRLKVNYACVGKVSVHFIKYRTELPLDHVIIRDNYKNGKKKRISETEYIKVNLKGGSKPSLIKKPNPDQKNT